jgi:hypothetical protein
VVHPMQSRADDPNAALVRPRCRDHHARGHSWQRACRKEAPRYSLELEDRTLVLPSPVSLTLDDGRVLGREPREGRGARARRGDRNADRQPCAGEERLTGAGAGPGGRRDPARPYLRRRLCAALGETPFPGRIRVRDEGFIMVFLEEPRGVFLISENAHHGYEGLWRRERISAESAMSGRAPLAGGAAARARAAPGAEARRPAGGPRSLPCALPHAAGQSPAQPELGLPAARGSRATRGLDELRPGGARARRGYRGDIGDAVLSLARARRRRVRHRPRRERHSHAAGGSRGAGRGLLLGGARARGLLGELEHRGRRLHHWTQHHHLQALR